MQAAVRGTLFRHRIEVKAEVSLPGGSALCSWGHVLSLNRNECCHAKLQVLASTALSCLASTWRAVHSCVVRNQFKDTRLWTSCEFLWPVSLSETGALGSGKDPSSTPDLGRQPVSNSDLLTCVHGWVYCTHKLSSAYTTYADKHTQGRERERESLKRKGTQFAQPFYGSWLLLSLLLFCVILGHKLHVVF